MELFHANKQWSTRPADERFPTVQALYDATKAYADTARTLDLPLGALRTEASKSGEVLITHATSEHPTARLTNWAFGQLAARMGAPASYLRTLPATMAVQNLNYALARVPASKELVASLLFHMNAGLLLRAITSDKYSRIWNYEVAERLLDLEAKGWQPAVPDIRIKAENETALYASDHDMFAFLRNPNLTVAELNSTGAVYRGVIVANSEVGASSLTMTRFLYREMCGNHIIWGASKVVELNLRHVGNIRERSSLWAVQAKQWAEEGAAAEEAMITRSKHALIGGTKAEVLDALFGKRSLALSRKTLDAGYDATVEDEDGDPRTVWGMVQGLTRYSQTLPYADARATVDKAAGKILEFQF